MRIIGRKDEKGEEFAGKMKPLVPDQYSLSFVPFGQRCEANMGMTHDKMCLFV